MGTEHVAELLPDYVLGCIDEQDNARVDQHLKVCPDCQAELHAYQSVVGELALAVCDTCDAAPPAELKARLMECIQEKRTPVPLGRPWWRVPLDSLSGLRGGALAWQVAAVALVVVLAAGNVWQWQRSSGLAQPQVAHMGSIPMMPSTAAPAATGMLVVSTDGQYGTLIVDGLPALDAGHQYQLWMIEGGQRASGPVFSVNAEGYGSMPVSSSRPLSSYKAFGVTVEPVGGSAAPTGERVLSGTL
jgi:anti-sigma-K factor RskA